METPTRERRRGRPMEFFFANHTVACQNDPFWCSRWLAFRLRNHVSDSVYPFLQWGRVTHICVSKLNIVGSNKGLYVCVLIRVYLYVCMHVYIYMCIYMCSIYMFMRRVCIHTRKPYFSELRFYVEYNIENRPFLGRGFNHAYIWMFHCVLYVIWNTYGFNVFYWTCGIRIVLLVFTWYVEYLLSACIFLSCFIYLCLVRNDLINMFKQTCRLLGAKATIWTSAGILLIGPSGTNVSEILIEITFSSEKVLLKMSSLKWQPFCRGLNVLIVYWAV